MGIPCVKLDSVIHPKLASSSTCTDPQNNIKLGYRVSVDQIECGVKVRLLYSKGKEDPEKVYIGGTIFMDNGSQYIDL